MEWISVKDRLPDKQILCLCIDNFGDYRLMLFNGVQFEDDYDKFYEGYAEARYWMLLPEPPKTK